MGRLFLNSGSIYSDKSISYWGYTVLLWSAVFFGLCTPHVGLVVISDVNSVAGLNRKGYPEVGNPYGLSMFQTTIPFDNGHLLLICALQDLAVTSSSFKTKMILQCTWLFNTCRSIREINLVLKHDRRFLSHTLSCEVQAPATVL